MAEWADVYFMEKGVIIEMWMRRAWMEGSTDSGFVGNEE